MTDFKYKPPIHTQAFGSYTCQLDGMHGYSLVHIIIDNKYLAHNAGGRLGCDGRVEETPISYTR